jgi:hypothetical protein
LRPVFFCAITEFFSKNSQSFIIFIDLSSLLSINKLLRTKKKPNISPHPPTQRPLPLKPEYDLIKNWHSPDFLSGFALWNFASKYPFDVMCQCGLLKYHDPKTKKNKNENTRKDKGLVSFSLIKRTRQNQNQNQNSCSKGGLTLVIFSYSQKYDPGKLWCSLVLHGYCDNDYADLDYTSPQARTPGPRGTPRDFGVLIPSLIPPPPPREQNAPALREFSGLVSASSFLI